MLAQPLELFGSNCNFLLLVWAGARGIAASAGYLHLKTVRTWGKWSRNLIKSFRKRSGKVRGPPGQLREGGRLSRSPSTELRPSEQGTEWCLQTMAPIIAANWPALMFLTFNRMKRGLASAPQIKGRGAFVLFVLDCRSTRVLPSGE